MRRLLLLVWLSGTAAATQPDSPAAQWDRLLRTHVVKGRVHYGGFHRERVALEGYLESVARATKPDLALYINAYNATVVASVLRHGRPARVLDVKGFFDGEKHTIAGRRLTLNELENEARKRYADPRIHFALNCAARSCPPLHGRAFEAATLDGVLDQLTRTFVNGSGVRVDEKGKKIAVSKLFEWYREDFVAKEGSVEKYLSRWVTEPRRRAALEAGYELVFQDYDWALNTR